MVLQNNITKCTNFCGQQPIPKTLKQHFLHLTFQHSHIQHLPTTKVRQQNSFSNIRSINLGPNGLLRSTFPRTPTNSSFTLLLGSMFLSPIYCCTKRHAADPSAETPGVSRLKSSLNKLPVTYYSPPNGRPGSIPDSIQRRRSARAPASSPNSPGAAGAHPRQSRHAR
jgi:hypothetical protein